MEEEDIKDLNGFFILLATIVLIIVLGVLFSFNAFAADTNTVSSTVVTDKSVPTANAPSVVVNNNDVCRTGMSVGAQTGFVGISTGHTIIDKNCERIKLARSLYFMGMKVAAISILCQDARVYIHPLPGCEGIRRDDHGRNALSVQGEDWPGSQAGVGRGPGRRARGEQNVQEGRSRGRGVPGSGRLAHCMMRGEWVRVLAWLFPMA